MEVYDDGIIQVSYGKFDKLDKDSLIVIADAKKTYNRSYESNNKYYVETNLVKVLIDKTSFNICFEDTNGKKLSSVSCPIMESYDIYKESGGSVKTRKTVDGVKSSAMGGEKRFVRSSFHAKMTFDIHEEILFGLGSHDEGYPCINGNFVPLYQENMRIAIGSKQITVFSNMASIKN